MELELQLITEAVALPNVTALVPWVAPKYIPVIVTGVPATPDTGLTPLIFGADDTVKLEPLLATPPTVTTMLPVVAPAGTCTDIPLSLQLPGVAATPLKVTVLLPWVEPKLEPLIHTYAPMPPCVGLVPEIWGVVTTVKAEPLLATPPTVTTTLPVVAPAGTCTDIPVSLQLPGAAATPLKVSVLPP
jgi:hypothetical protein